MGIAAMVIGIVALLVGFIPLLGVVGIFPALVGLALGSVDVVLKGKKKLPRGMSVAGVVLNVVAIGVIVLWTMVIVGGATTLANAANEAGHSASMTSTKGIILNRLYVQAVGQRGKSVRAEFLEFWNNSNKPVASFTGTLTVYDRSNPDREDSSTEVTCETPLAPNAKLWLMRMYANGVLQQSAESEDRGMLEQYAKSMEVSPISMAVEKYRFESGQVAIAK